MNIGLGIVFSPLAVILLLFGFYSIKKNDIKIGIVLLITGTIILACCTVLLTGLYDPYANHLN